MSKKFLYCKNCKKETWATQVSGFYFQCSACDADINLLEAKKFTKAERKEQRERKAKEMGTFISEHYKKKAREERRREVDEDYLNFIRSQKCCVPTCQRSICDAHHVHRKSQLGSDRTAIPLCMECHASLHAIGVKTFALRHGIDYAALIDKFNAAYDAGPTTAKTY